MGTLIQATTDYSSYQLAKIIDAVAAIEADLSNVNNVYEFGAIPNSFTGVTAPFVLHMPAAYRPNRWSGAGDRWRRLIVFYSAIMCIDRSKHQAMQYPASFEEAQLLGDVYFDTFAETPNGTTAFDNRTTICAAAGLEDLTLEDLTFGPMIEVGAEDWVGWVATFQAKIWIQS